MKKFVVSISTFFLSTLAVGMLNVANATSLLPDQISDLFNLLGGQGESTTQFVTSRVQLGLVIALGVVVLVAVVYAILAAIRYIRSQGEAGEIEEATKAIKAIFFGIGAMLIAIVGIVLVFVFFGATRPGTELFQTCISEPGSDACGVCLADGRDGNNQCEQCEKEYDRGRIPPRGRRFCFE